MSYLKSVVYVVVALLVGLIIGYVLFSSDILVVAEATDNLVFAEVEVDISSLVDSIAQLERKVDALLECGCGAPVTDTEVVTFMVPVLREKSVIVEVCNSVTETVSITNTVVPSTSIIITTPVVTPVTVTPTPVTTTPTPTPTPTNTPTPTATPTEVPPTAVPPTAVPTSAPTKAPKVKCNQGRGNGSEDCSPGKSDVTVNPGHPKGPNDEPPPAKGKRPGAGEEVKVTREPKAKK